MKEGQKLWTRKELILAINQYCKMRFGKIHQSNPEIVHLANLIGRSSGAVSRKLTNFASFDTSLKERGISGSSNTSKLDKEIWNEFYQNWDELAFESEKVKAEFEGTSIEKLHHIDETELPKAGDEKERQVKARVNQEFFRQMILANYNYSCCITGLNQQELLIAGHIKEWKADAKNRINPRNGLAINTLHDRAFERGLITITTEYRIKVSSELKEQKKNPVISDYFLIYDDQLINLPTRFLPDQEFLAYHNLERFRK